MLRPQQQPLVIARAAGHHACMPADTFADPAQQPIEILRRLENLARLGVVAQVRTGKPARCRVRTGELLTAWVPWMALRAGGAAKGRRWSAPAVGEQCLLIAPGGDLQSAIALPGIYSDAMPQGSDSETTDRTDWSETDYLEHDRATATLTINVAQAITLIVGGTRLHLTPSGTTLETPQLTVKSPQSTFTGKVTVQGLLSYQAGLSGRAGGGGGNVISGGLAMEGGSITHDGKNIGGTHTHPGDSGGTTGAPR